MDDQDRIEHGTDIDFGGTDGFQGSPSGEEAPIDVQPGSLPGHNPSEEGDDEEQITPDEERVAAPDEEEYPVDPEAAETDQEAAPETPSEELPASPTREEMPKGMRGYVILRPGAEPGEWLEAFERPGPEEPYLLAARSGIEAIRRAYKLLDVNEPVCLLAITESQWKPRHVGGKPAGRWTVVVE